MKQYNLIVLGSGESGVGAALLAQQKGFSVLVSDAGKIAEQYKAQLLAAKIDFEENTHSEEIILAAELIVKSPGIPEKAPLIKSLRKKGTPIVSEIEFASRYTQKPIIAITGTNGKTTTTLLTHHLLKTANFKVGLGGNIGHSFAALVMNDDLYDNYVLEISSFQLDDAFDFHPFVSLLLNITPDHLDRYNYKMEEYAVAKYKITQKQTEKDFFIYNHLDNWCNQVETKAIKKPISIHEKNAPTRTEDGKLIVDEKISLLISELPLKGEHNLFNMMCAISVASILNIPTETIKNALDSFVNAPHRLEEIAIINHVRYINDSKATNVDAVSYALNAFSEPLIWIVGGVDKGNDYGLIAEAVQKNVRAIICLGKDNTKLETFFADKIKTIVSTNSMQAAVEAAAKIAQAGEVVLLSPACASFDLFNNYMHRGEMFGEEVRKLAKKH